MANETEAVIDVDPHSNATVRWLAAAGVAGPLLFWVVVVALGVMTPGYSHASDGISDLGAIGAPYAIVQQAAFVVLGVGIIAFAVGLDRQFRGGWRPWLGVVLLGLLGLLGAIGPGVFPVDRARPEAMTNQLHTLVTTLGFLAGLVGIPLATWRLAAAERWPVYRSRVTVLGVTVLVVGAFAVFITQVVGQTAWAGYAQRLYAGVMSGWVAYHAYRLYRMTGAA